MNSLCVGSSIEALQKRDLTKAIRDFSFLGKQGYTMSLVRTQSDRFTFSEADVTIGMTSGDKKLESDVIIHSDIHMTDLFGLSYLLFKHGN